MKKFLIIISYNSRKITAWILALYLFAMFLLKSKYSEEIERINFPVIFLFVGLYIGMSLMAISIKYLNKQSTKSHPLYNKLTKK